MRFSFERLCLDLFLLAQLKLEDCSKTRGARWEARIVTHLVDAGASTETLPGGCTFRGRASLSGLRHQLDAVVQCSDAIVVGEWKAHSRPIPKNDLLRFKAATDDYYLALGPYVPTFPILRVFGGQGSMAPGLRRYAALWGITLIESDYWPAPVIASNHASWPGYPDPDMDDRRQVGWLSRPLQQVFVREVTGNYRVAAMPSLSKVDLAIATHQFWSDELWNQMDQTPGLLESLVNSVSGGTTA